MPEVSIRDIILAYPNCNYPPGPGTVRHAIYALSGPGMNPRFQTESEAAAWLLGRVQAYAASPLVRTTPQGIRLSGARWFREEHYDCPDESWAQEYAHAPIGGAKDEETWAQKAAKGTV